MSHCWWTESDLSIFFIMINNRQELIIIRYVCRLDRTNEVRSFFQMLNRKFTPVYKEVFRFTSKVIIMIELQYISPVGKLSAEE